MKGQPWVVCTPPHSAVALAAARGGGASMGGARAWAVRGAGLLGVLLLVYENHLLRHRYGRYGAYAIIRTLCI